MLPYLLSDPSSFESIPEILSKNIAPIAISNQWIFIPESIDLIVILSEISEVPIYPSLMGPPLFPERHADEFYQYLLSPRSSQQLMVFIDTVPHAANEA
jgi:hypothetical protein